MVAINDYLAVFLAFEADVKKVVGALVEGFEKTGITDDVLSLEAKLEPDEDSNSDPPLEPLVKEFTSEDIALIQLGKFGIHTRLRIQMPEKYQQVWDYFYTPAIFKDYRDALAKKNQYSPEHIKDFIEHHAESKRLKKDIGEYDFCNAVVIQPILKGRKEGPYRPPENIPAVTECGPCTLTEERDELLKLAETVSKKIAAYSH